MMTINNQPFTGFMEKNTEHPDFNQQFYKEVL